MIRSIRVALSLVLFLAAGIANAQTATRPTLGLETAKRILAAAEAEAVRQNFPSSIAIVDDGGNALLLTRVGDWTPASSRVAIGKARTAATFRRSTNDFEQIIGRGRTAMVALEDFTPLQGGLPIVVQGTVVGAIGVSGSNPPRDEEIALAGLKVLEAAASSASALPVEFFASDRVAQAFARGEVLLNGDGRNYMVHTSRRTAPGMAEVHTRDADIIYVQDGTATIVTGGRIVDAAETAADEIRGPRIEGGERRRLSKGDVLIVPPGTPHWFSEVRGTFTYYVVKVR